MPVASLLRPGPLGRRPRAGFTLVELLVVIGIIAILMALLMPLLQKSRYEAQVTACAARLQQFAAAVNTYAVENKGRLPRFDVFGMDPVPVANLGDVGTEFYDLFRSRYALPHEAMFCPLSRDELVGREWREPWRDGIYRIGYALWVPRRHVGVTIPPSPDDGQVAVYTLETTPFCGPTRQGDAFAPHHPILTDLMMSNFWERILPCKNASEIKTQDLTRDAQHIWNQRVHSFNAAYLDGHVERLRADEVRPRFQSAAGNWAYR